MAGLWAYLGAWDFTQLENPVMWSQAVTQSLFSVGVTFGVMSTYASYNNHTQGAVADSVMVRILSHFFIFINFISNIEFKIGCNFQRLNFMLLWINRVHHLGGNVS